MDNLAFFLLIISESDRRGLLNPGDVLILSEGDRMKYHAFKGIIRGEKRINLTIRQVRVYQPN
jgi:hypothetical protein